MEKEPENKPVEQETQPDPILSETENETVPAEELSTAPAAETPGGKREKETVPGQELYQNVRTLVTVLAVLILIFTFVCRVIVVSGPSMQNTLHGGDTMLVWSLGYTPRAGDIVVLTKRSYQEESIVKRVIATEGQTVDIDYTTGTVYVDGVALVEDYIRERMLYPTYGEWNNHVTVPEGCIYVMGDNRNMSADSRYPDIGIVDVRCVIGRAVMVLFPFSAFKVL